ncbi:hypothetical protein F4703DRAFT_1912966 [Phycomyces blakesleeanus]
MRLIKKYLPDSPNYHQPNTSNQKPFISASYSNPASSQSSLFFDTDSCRSGDIATIKDILSHEPQKPRTSIRNKISDFAEKLPVVTQNKSRRPEEIQAELDEQKKYSNLFGITQAKNNGTERSYPNSFQPENLAGILNADLFTELVKYMKNNAADNKTVHALIDQETTEESVKKDAEYDFEYTLKKNLDKINTKYAVLCKANTSLKRGIKNAEKSKETITCQAQLRDMNYQKEIRDLQDSLAATKLELAGEKENSEILNKSIGLLKGENDKLKDDNDTLKNENDTLREENDKLKEKNTEILNQAQSRERRCERIINSLRLQSTTSQAELIEKKMEYQILLSEFQSHVDTVPTAEDDLFTIHAKLNIVQTKISDLCMSLKDFLNPNEGEVYNIFFDNWKEDSFRYKVLMEKRGDGSYGFDYGIISLLVESFITEYLINEVYDVPIYLGLPINTAYTELSEWEPFKNCANWSRKLRKQLCSLASRPEISEKLNENRAQVTRNILKPLSAIFTRITPATITKVTAIVNLASQISLAMHSQDVPVKCIKLKEGKDKINNTMRSLYGSIEGETTIQIVVCPPFIANEGQETESVLLEGKVICFERPQKGKTLAVAD